MIVYVSHTVTTRHSESCAPLQMMKRKDDYDEDYDDEVAMNEDFPAFQSSSQDIR